mgnify:CR=1 FL=1
MLRLKTSASESESSYMYIRCMLAAPRKILLCKNAMAESLSIRSYTKCRGFKSNQDNILQYIITKVTLGGVYQAGIHVFTKTQTNYLLDWPYIRKKSSQSSVKEWSKNKIKVIFELGAIEKHLFRLPTWTCLWILILWICFWSHLPIWGGTTLNLLWDMVIYAPD